MHKRPPFKSQHSKTLYKLQDKKGEGILWQCKDHLRGCQCTQSNTYVTPQMRSHVYFSKYKLVIARR